MYKAEYYIKADERWECCTTCSFYIEKIPSIGYHMLFGRSVYEVVNTRQEVNFVDIYLEEVEA
jgi:hypothetical protein